MPTLTINKEWNDTEVLNESDLDFIKNDIETFINDTKLDSDNLQLDTITAGFTATQGNNVAASMTLVGAKSIFDVADGTHAMPAAAADKVLTQSSSAGADSIFNKVDRTTGTSVTSPDVGVSASSGTFTSTESGRVDLGNGEAVTNLSVTITTQGKPVMIFLDATTPTTEQGIAVEPTATGTFDMGFGLGIARDGTMINTINYRTPNVVVNSTGADECLWGIPGPFIDVVVAGTYVYTVEVGDLEPAANARIKIKNLRLIAIEL